MRTESEQLELCLIEGVRDRRTTLPRHNRERQGHKDRDQVIGMNRKTRAKRKEMGESELPETQ